MTAVGEPSTADRPDRDPLLQRSGTATAQSENGAPPQPATERVPEQSYPMSFEAQVRAAPSVPAIEWRNDRWSYRELNARANQIAHWLIARGIGPERLVGVAVPRSAAQIAVILGVVKTGAAYLLINPAHPAERIRSMTTDARPAFVLTTSCTTQDLAGVLAVEAVAVDAPDVVSAWERCARTDPEDDDRLQPLSPVQLT
ncbi:AMP-binding protein [Streptomyces zagrosensis]|uniref:Non-ribosomal peptide synthetase component F n=1 Tax=Streptomyces zagrosensis TaxID=1042984 RepID=A0A7W9QGE6_9ACTN|nr:AMP-binding protein [Streptomyces zagrosensis]MBB5939775.1 non-ribosomal peptide synthetase component F [Streptomyces zagrosensis]